MSEANREDVETQCVVDCVVFFYEDGKGGNIIVVRASSDITLTGRKKTVQTERVHMVSLQHTLLLPLLL